MEEKDPNNLKGGKGKRTGPSGGAKRNTPSGDSGADAPDYTSSAQGNRKKTDQLLKELQKVTKSTKNISASIDAISSKGLPKFAAAAKKVSGIFDDIKTHNESMLKQELISPKSAKKAKERLANISESFENLISNIDDNIDDLGDGFAKTFDISELESAIGKAGNSIDKKLKGTISGVLNVLKAEQAKLKTVDDILKERGLTLKGVAEDIKKPFDTLFGKIKSLPGGSVLSKIFGFDKIQKDIQSKIQKSLIDSFAKGRSTGMSMLSALGSGFKGIFSNIGKISGALGIGLLLGGIALVVKAIFGLDKKITKIAKDFDISKEAAGRLQRQAVEVANSMSAIGVRSEDVIANVAAVNEQMGILINANSQFAKDLTLVTKGFGLTGEEALKLNGVAASLGTNITDIVAKTANMGKGFMSQRSVLKEISKVSKTIAIQFRGNVVELGKQVIKAKLLGTTLDRIQEIGDAMLDIESSITAETKARLLTGKNISLNAARYYSITGQTGKLMDEITNQVGTFADYQKMFPLQQKALAEAFNMTREELSEMLTKQEELRLAGISYDQAQSLMAKNSVDIQKELNQAQAAGNKNKAEYLEKLVKEKRQAEITEKFQAAIANLAEKAQIVFLPIIEKLAGFLNSFIPNIQSAANMFGSSGDASADLNKSVNSTSKTISTAAVHTAGFTASLGTASGFAKDLKDVMGIVKNIVSGVVKFMKLFSGHAGTILKIFIGYKVLKTTLSVVKGLSSLMQGMAGLNMFGGSVMPSMGGAMMGGGGGLGIMDSVLGGGYASGGGGGYGGYTSGRNRRGAGSQARAKRNYARNAKGQFKKPGRFRMRGGGGGFWAAVGRVALGMAASYGTGELMDYAFSDSDDNSGTTTPPGSYEFKTGTLRTGRGGVDGDGGFHAILHPGEAVIPRHVNEAYHPAIKAIFNQDVSPDKVNRAVVSAKKGLPGFAQGTLHANDSTAIGHKAEHIKHLGEETHHAVHMGEAIHKAAPALKDTLKTSSTWGKISPVFSEMFKSAKNTTLIQAISKSPIGNLLNTGLSWLSSTKSTVGTAASGIYNWLGETTLGKAGKGITNFLGKGKDAVLGGLGNLKNLLVSGLSKFSAGQIILRLGKLASKIPILATLFSGLDGIVNIQKAFDSYNSYESYGPEKLAKSVGGEGVPFLTRIVGTQLGLMGGEAVGTAVAALLGGATGGIGAALQPILSALGGMGGGYVGNKLGGAIGEMLADSGDFSGIGTALMSLWPIKPKFVDKLENKNKKTSLLSFISNYGLGGGVAPKAQLAMNKPNVAAAESTSVKKSLPKFLEGTLGQLGLLPESQRSDTYSGITATLENKAKIASARKLLSKEEFKQQQISQSALSASLAGLLMVSPFGKNVLKPLKITKAGFANSLGPILNTALSAFYYSDDINNMLSAYDESEPGFVTPVDLSKSVDKLNWTTVLSTVLGSIGTTVGASWGGIAAGTLSAPVGGWVAPAGTFIGGLVGGWMGWKLGDLIAELANPNGDENWGKPFLKYFSNRIPERVTNSARRIQLENYVNGTDAGNKIIPLKDLETKTTTPTSTVPSKPVTPQQQSLRDSIHNQLQSAPWKTYKGLLEGTPYTVTATDNSRTSPGSYTAEQTKSRLASEQAQKAAELSNQLKASAQLAYISIDDIVKEDYVSKVNAAKGDSSKAEESDKALAKAIVNQESLSNYFTLNNSLMRTLRFKRRKEARHSDNNLLTNYKTKLESIKSYITGNKYPSAPYDLQSRLTEATDNIDANTESDVYRNVISGKLPMASFLKPFTTLYDLKIHDLALRKLSKDEQLQLLDKVAVVDTTGNAPLEKIKLLALDDLDRLSRTKVAKKITKGTANTSAITPSTVYSPMANYNPAPDLVNKYSVDNIGQLYKGNNEDLKQSILKQKETQDRLNELALYRDPAITAAMNNPIQVHDTLIRPGMPPIKFRADDLVLKYKDGTIAAGTNLLGEDNSATTVMPPSPSYVIGRESNTGTVTTTTAPATVNNNDSDTKKIIELLTKLIQKVDQPVVLKIGDKAMLEMNKQTSVQKSYSAHFGNRYGA